MRCDSAGATPRTLPALFLPSSSRAAAACRSHAARLIRKRTLNQTVEHFTMDGRSCAHVEQHEL